ncbi:hypothetical protein [Enterovirga rhinocerotis]|uniref:Uncharacterized protein n=1 Tax=Enterovirga rhinocerotis TaxID=1339210 RepID=A0A4R7C760_9HYPH|nr:hypothetical protein [Enterovirga rhinocerotis]TDR93802.1 hypothetical protein EV668_1069 [Enterovirga rhinocerotis]
MPTVSEPAEPIIAAILPRGCTALAEHLLSAILLDLADRGVRATPLGVIHYALTVGVPEDIAADLGRLVESQEEARLAA